MNRLRKAADYLLGYNRREKRATLILVIILLLLMLIRYINIPSERPEIYVNVIKDSLTSGISDEGSSNNAGLFDFDPNTADSKTLMELGMSSKQASTLVKYRNAGAKFKTAGDLNKVYGMDAGLVKMLTPFVIIKGEIATTGKAGNADSLSGDYNIKPVREVCLIELNSSTADELQKLPGIGEKLSERIIRFRDLLGGFYSPDQLIEVYGIDTSALDNIMGLVYVNTDSVRKICIDTCSYKVLARHPYIGSSAARSIIKYRELMGVPGSLEELVRQKVIDTTRAHRMAPYCAFSTVKKEVLKGR
jgi:competence protein ComEA